MGASDGVQRTELHGVLISSNVRVAGSNVHCRMIVGVVRAGFFESHGRLLVVSDEIVFVVCRIPPAAEIPNLWAELHSCMQIILTRELREGVIWSGCPVH